MNKNKISGFTLAEVLITLVIIGVIAAFTVPTLIANHQKRQYAIQAKQTYSIVANIFRNMLARDGVMLLEDTAVARSVKASTYINDSGEDDFRREFSKIIISLDGKQRSSLSANDLKNVKLKTINGKNTTALKDNILYATRQSFFLNNGAVIYVWISHNAQACTASEATIKSLNGRMFKKQGEVVFDTNGLKGPNQWGRDLFIVAVTADGNVVPWAGRDIAICHSGIVGGEYYYKTSTTDACDPHSSSSSYRLGYSCLAKLMDENWEMNY